jgi:hypothetical protein
MRTNNNSELYFGLTDLEVELFKTIELLTGRIRELNGYLEKANGYGTESFSFYDLVERYEGLVNRGILSAQILTEDEFNKKFKFETHENRKKEKRAILIENGNYHHQVSIEQMEFIQNNFGKTFRCTISKNNCIGDAPEVGLVDTKFTFPISICCNIKSLVMPKLKVDTIDGDLNFRVKYAIQ